MRKVRPVDRIAVLGLLVGMVAACSSSSEHARAKIEALGIPFEPAGMETAVGSGDHALVELFLAAGYDPNTFDDPMRAPLSLAVSRLNAEITESLLEGGATAEKLPGILNVPVSRNDREMIDVLLAAGADVNLVDRTGRTPLVQALERKDTVLAALFLEHGADPDNSQRGNRKRTVPLIEAVRMNQRALAEVLLEGGATVDRPGGTPRETALMLASKNGNADLVELLLSHGADPRLEVRGRTAISEARRGGHEALVERLELAGGAN